tara:strand:+ start:269 stop:3082 length:2814 start_codon:yes stop_codon:yes gene_type:complete
MPVLSNRVKTAVASAPGTAASMSLGTPFPGYQSVTASGVTDQQVVRYLIEDQSNFEIGSGTYTSSTNSMTRTVIESTSANARINATATAVVMITLAAGDVVTSDGGTFTGSVSFQEHLDFTSINSPTYQEGRLWFDTFSNTFAYYSDIEGVTHEIGIEEHQRVYNNTGSIIFKGVPIYFSGNYTAGTIDVPTVALADATSSAAYNAQGLSAHDIAINSYGYCIVAGQLHSVDTSSLNAGTNFFVGLTPGAVQNDSPLYPNFPMCLGWVVNSDATDGVLLVNQQNHSVRSFRVQTSAHIGSNLQVDGDLTVLGQYTTGSTANVNIGGSIQNLNAGDTIGEANTVFVGTGLDDAFYSGHYKGTTSNLGYYLRIDSVGAVDTFEWSHSPSFSPTVATGVAITGSDQALVDGINIKFSAVTGHTSGDKWTGTATPIEVDTGIFSNRNTGSTGIGYTNLGVFFDVSTSKWRFVSRYSPDPVAPIDITDASYVSGTLVADTFEGNASTADALQTARDIGGVSFDGTANIDLPGVNTAGNQNTSGNAATATTATTSGSTTGNAATATVLATARDIGGVSFDGSADIDLPGVNSAGNQNTTGNAATATVLATARDIGGVSFDGSADIDLPGVNSAGNQNTTGNAATATTATTSGSTTGNAATATSLQTARNIAGVSFDGSADIDLPGVNSAGNQNTTGNAATATSLQTARNIAGVSFDGTADISIASTNLTSVTSDASEINLLNGMTGRTATAGDLSIYDTNQTITYSYSDADASTENQMIFKHLQTNQSTSTNITDFKFFSNEHDFSGNLVGEIQTARMSFKSATSISPLSAGGMSWYVYWLGAERLSAIINNGHMALIAQYQTGASTYQNKYALEVRPSDSVGDNTEVKIGDTTKLIFRQDPYQTELDSLISPTANRTLALPDKDGTLTTNSVAYGMAVLFGG